MEAVREGVSERDAEAISGLKKPEMASHAERLLAETHWLPPLLRTPGQPNGVETSLHEPEESVNAVAAE